VDYQALSEERNMRIIAMIALAIAMAAPSMALAKGPPWGGNPGGHPGNFGNLYGPGHPSVPSGRPGNFAANDQSAIQVYYRQAYARGACPPGLAKKHNGCMPPGLARRWIVGQPLPVGIAWYSVPYDLLVRLTPPPLGFRYVYVDGAVLLFNPATRLVADGVTININIR
jgi:hypothetical protein